MANFQNNQDPLEKVIKLSRIPAHYRTVDETTHFKQFLTRFDFFRNQVGEKALDNVLNLATKYLKHRKIEAGDFVYHTSKFLLNYFNYHSLFILSIISKIK